MALVPFCLRCGKRPPKAPTQDPETKSISVSILCWACSMAMSQSNRTRKASTFFRTYDAFTSSPQPDRPT